MNLFLYFGCPGLENKVTKHGASEILNVLVTFTSYFWRRFNKNWQTKIKDVPTSFWPTDLLNTGWTNSSSQYISSPVIVGRSHSRYMTVYSILTQNQSFEKEIFETNRKTAFLAFFKTSIPNSKN